MQVAIVHYHLNRGGVTQVIVNHLLSLASTCGDGEDMRVAILYGGRKQDWPDSQIDNLDGVQVSYEIVPMLEYDTTGIYEPEELARQLIATLAQAGMDPDQTVLHIHNHALGKNLSLPGAITHLAGAGYPLLLQIHDFPEDSRPANYQSLLSGLAPDNPEQLSQILYPQSSAIHYATLNGRDFRILDRAGVAGDQLHSLPNPVSDFGQLPDRATSRQRLAQEFDIDSSCRYILYPVRGIRRKNLGEALLWSAVAGDSTQIGLTLPPLNPVEQRRYEAWKRVAAQCGLPFVFDVGGPQGLTYLENLASADSVITTSVAEGFGMVFLEAWLAGRHLTGRDLPEITGDYVQSGVDLSGLMSRFAVPVDWIGYGEFEHELAEAYRLVLTAYNRPLPSQPDFSREAAEMVCDGLLDFARCSAKLQGELISQVASNASRRDQLLELNPAVMDHLSVTAADTADLVRENAAAVRRTYSLQSSGQRLRELYKHVLASGRSEPSALERSPEILDAFLGLSRLYPIRIQ